MNEYFTGAVTQMIQRGETLLDKIPATLPREFYLLAQKCQQQLGEALDALRSLLEDPRMLELAYQPERLRRFRRAVADIDVLETLGIGVLERYNKADIRLNRLVEAIRNEIVYPLLPPVVSSLSRGYFYIHPPLDLLLVPLGEERFLLHLPDLYHELAHPLIYNQHNPKVKPFKQALSEAMDGALTYLEGEADKEDRRRGPDAFSFYLSIWQRSWIEAWTVEFFCDLFAIYTLGPAFAWSHLHLCAKRGVHPYYVPLRTPSRHPADDARMTVMLHGLRQTGFTVVADDIARRWHNLLTIAGARPEPEFPRCYPGYLLHDIAVKAFNGVDAMKCRIARPETCGEVHSLLNEAWSQFWANPEAYADWEQSAVENLLSFPVP